MNIKITCPYCGNVFHLCFTSLAAELVYCDQEESDGCGQMFILEVTPREPRKIYRKVDGEVDYPAK